MICRDARLPWQGGEGESRGEKKNVRTSGTARRKNEQAEFERSTGETKKGIKAKLICGHGRGRTPLGPNAV